MVNEMLRHLQRAENMYLETPTYNIVLHSLLQANEVSFHRLIALLKSSLHQRTYSSTILIVITN